MLYFAILPLISMISTFIMGSFKTTEMTGLIPRRTGLIIPVLYLVTRPKVAGSVLPVCILVAMFCLKVIKRGSLKLLSKKHQNCSKFEKENYQNLSRNEENMKHYVFLIEPSQPAERQGSPDQLISLNRPSCDVITAIGLV